MTDSAPRQHAAQLQEAIDTIVQTFDHPSSLSIRYTVEAGTKRTRFERESTGETFELAYDGSDDEMDPELVSLD